VNRLAFAALALLVFSIPAENGVSIPGIGSLSRLIGFGAIGLAVVALFDRGILRIRVPSLFLLVATAFVVWTGFTFYWSLEPFVTLSRTIQYAQLLALAWMVHQQARTERQQDLLMQAFVLGCYLMIAVAAATALGPGRTGYRDVMFPANSFAIVAGLAIPMAWGLVIRRPLPTVPVLRVLNGLYPAFALFAVVLAASRGGLLVALVGFIVIPLTLTHLGLVRRIALVFATTAIIAGTLVFLPTAIPDVERNLERLGRLEEDLLKGTMTGRTRIWDAGIQVFRNDPIVGVGAGSYGRAVEPILGSARAAHNAFLSVAVSSGMVGVGIFFTMFAVVLVGLVAKPTRRVDQLVLFAAVVLAMMPASSENDKFLWFVLASMASARPVLLKVAGAAAPSSTIVS
jgi:O-antigen ligase